MFHELEAMAWERVDDRLRRKVVHGDRMSVTTYDFAAGGTFPDHTHEQEQITYVVRGELTFTIDDGPVPVAAGNLIVIPPGVRHAARAERGATVISVVSPSRRTGKGITFGAGTAQ